LQDGGGPGEFHDPHPAPGPVAVYGDYDAGEAWAFSGGDVQDGDGGDLMDGACPLPGAGPDQDLSVIRCVTGDHEALDVVHVLVTYF
jgi:hypothetical protein